jgi:hypothetical protein
VRLEGLQLAHDMGVGKRVAMVVFATFQAVRSYTKMAM